MKIELIRDTDAQELFDLTESSRAYLREWLPWVDHVKSVADTKDFITSCNAGYHTKISMTFIIRDAGKLVGVCGFNKFDWDSKHGEIGYWLGKDFQGKGLVTKACKQLEEIAFSDLGLIAIDIRAAEFNLPSRSIPERLGYTKTEQIPDAEWLYDHHVDHIVYEKKKEDSN